MKLTISADARADLRDISEYTLQNWDVNQERVYLETIYDRLEEIASDPERWRKRNDLFEGCRSSLVGKHIIFFLIKDERIHVSRVLHQTMDVHLYDFPF